jgi:hypothetical protein
VAASAGAATGTAIEYFHAEFGHYFVSAFAEDQAALDSGMLKGWARTGESFVVDTTGGGDLLPVCRFFSATFAPKSSHFYTPIASECESLKQGQVWTYEGIAFQVTLPDARGACPTGLPVLYRLYNDGMSGAPNHRYTTRVDVFATMRVAGWTPEGHGVTYAFACVQPTPLLPLATAEGFWTGTVAGGGNFTAIFLENGDSWVVYGTGAVVEGIMRGTVTSSGAQFAGTLRNYDFGEDLIVANDLSGTYESRATIAGTSTGPLGNATFSGTYRSFYEFAARPELVAGTWVGALEGTDVLTLAVSASGQVTGTSPSGCQVSGTIQPRASGKNVYDVAVTFGGAQCSIGTGSGNGVAYVAASPAVVAPSLVLLVEANDRSGALPWIGAKR